MFDIELGNITNIASSNGYNPALMKKLANKFKYKKFITDATRGLDIIYSSTIWFDLQMNEELKKVFIGHIKKKILLDLFFNRNRYILLKFPTLSQLQTSV